MIIRNQKIEAVDLFCGIGGLSFGLLQANIDVIAGLDINSFCKEIYEKNNKSKFILADISKYNFQEMKNIYSRNSIRALVGCAPCQPFSSLTSKVKKKNDARWNLINYFLQAVKILNPHLISMENVRGIIKTDIFKTFVKKIKKIGYNVNFDIVYCPDYGVPQNRSRLVLLGSKLGEIPIPQKTHSKNKYVAIKNIIKKLPKLKSGETNKKDAIHSAAKLSPINLKRIQQSKPKGTWHDWDKELLPNCYKKKSGESYTNVYGRMDWNKIAPTITTQFFSYGCGRFGHPEQDRALSIREGALLQTFPKNYKFGHGIPITKIGRCVGNAVPPRLGFIIGEAMKKHINSFL